MKLLGMTDFVLKQDKKRETFSRHENQSVLAVIINYANFLKQPLTLGMFVPCDDEGNVLEEPLKTKSSDGKRDVYYGGEKYIEQYQQAKERVLFEGFTAKYTQGVHEKYWLIQYKTKTVWLSWNESKTVQDLLDHADIELTPTAIKKLGL